MNETLVSKGEGGKFRIRKWGNFSVLANELQKLYLPKMCFFK